MIKAINQVISGRNGFIDTLLKNIDTALDTALDEGTEDNDTKLGELQNELLLYVELNASARVNYTKYDMEYEALANSIRELRVQRHNIVEHSAERQGKRQRIAEMTNFLGEQSCVLQEYDDQLTRKPIERVTVSGGKLTIKFKSVVKIEVEIYDIISCQIMLKVHLSGGILLYNVTIKYTKVGVRMVKQYALNNLKILPLYGEKTLFELYL